MKKIILITLMMFLVVIINAQTQDSLSLSLMKPLEVKRLLKVVENGATAISSDTLLAVDKTATKVFIEEYQKWGKKREKVALFMLAKKLEIPSLMEVSAFARYQNPPKVAGIGRETFKKLQDYELEVTLDKIQDFSDSAGYVLTRQQIGEELISVELWPWPVSKTLWDTYRFWVTPEDLKVVFDAATQKKIFSRYMFRLASYIAIETYQREGYSTNYKDIMSLIRQARKYEPRLVKKTLKKISKKN